MSVNINFIQRKSFRERAWKSLNLVVGITTILNVSMVGALVAPRAAQATNWPTDQQWKAPVCNDDPANDESPAWVDLKASGSEYGAAYYTDANNLYLRERVDADPVHGSPSDDGYWNEHAWVFIIQKDPGVSQYDYLVSLRGSGSGQNVELWQNTVKNGPINFSPLFNDPAEVQLQTWPTIDHARRVVVGSDYYVDWQIPLSALPNVNLLTSGLYFATSADANNYNKDHLDCYNAPQLSLTKDFQVNHTGPWYTDARTVPATTKPGDVLTYRVTVTNAGGPATAPITVVDELGRGGIADGTANIDPATQYSDWTTTKNLNSDGSGLSFTGTWGDGSPDGQANDTFTATLPSMAGGGVSESFTFDATVSASIPVGTTLLENTATSGSLVAETDINAVRTGQCVMTVDKYVKSGSDWVKTPTTAQPGDTLTYKVVYKNTGTADCTGGGVRIDDTIPTNSTYVAGSATPSDTNQSLNLSFGYPDAKFGTSNPTGFDGTKLSWNAHVVSPQETGSVTFQVTVNDQALCTNTTIENKAKVTADQIPNGIWSNGNTAVTTSVTTPCQGSIAGQKFNDVNGNGVKDAGDNGLSGWTIRLLNTSNVELATTTTDTNGNYTFGNLTPNTTYRLREVDQANWTRTTQNPSDILLGDAQNVTGINFGNFQRGKVDGYKFNDLNGNGVWDQPTEPALAGWKINVDVPGTNVDQEFTTNAQGYYSFWTPTPGTYSIWETQQTGWTQTAPNPHTAIVTATSGMHSVVNFGNHRDTGVITFEKVVRNFPSADLSAFHFAVDGQGDYQTGDSDTFMTGQYPVTENAVDHYHLVGATGACSYNADTKAITLNVTTQGGTCTVINERNAGKVTIIKQVVGGDANPKAWSFHAASGTGYTSSDSFIVPVGDYPIAEYNGVAGYTLTNMTGACALGTSPNLVFSFTPAQGVVHVTEGESICYVENTRDTGDLKIVKLYNQQPQSGVKFTVGTAQYTTDSNGEINVHDLPTGDYTVTETSPDGYHFVSVFGTNCTNGNPSTARVVKGDTTTCTFTNARDTGTINGHKWIDTNGNGVKDGNEVYYPSGVEIWLDQSTHTTTDGNGFYEFTNVPTGTYTVWEVVPQGWMNTSGNNVSVTLKNDGETKTVDFGNFELGKISGFKYDNHQNKLDGWTICLTPFYGDDAIASRVQQNCVVTGAGTWPLGYYEFTGLTVGQYVVTETMQTGWTNVTPISHIVNVTSGTNASVDFVNRQLFPDLTVSKTDGATTRNPNDTFTYTIVVTNQGEFEAVNPWATDTMPALMSYVSSTVDGVNATPDQSGQQLTWHLDTLAVNGTHTILVTVKLAAVFPNGTTEIQNCVNVSVDATESNGENNTACDTNTVDAAPTINLVKTGPATVTAGQNIVYTLTWSVSGNAVATNALVTDAVPANTTFVSSDCGTTLGVCTMSAVSGTVSWNLGTRNPGESGTVTMTVKAASPVANGTAVSNTGTFDTTENTPVISTVRTLIQSAPILSITKSNNIVGFTNPGKQVTYTITVTNSTTATDTAKNVVITDTLPAGFTFADTGVATKTTNAGDLAVGETKTFTYLVNIDANQVAGIYTNTASAKGDNTLTVVATSPVDVRVPSVLGVTSEPTIVLTKTVSATTVTAGGTVTYTVTISNPGDVDLTNVNLTDTLPKGFTFVDTGKATRTWSIGILKAHHQRIINYAVRVAAATKAGQYENKAVVTSTELDPQTAKVAVTVKAPRVLGLATTGAGFKDYLVFAFGLSFFLLGAAWITSLSRRPRHEHLSA